MISCEFRLTQFEEILTIIKPIAGFLGFLR
jgi:hypothetical protein